jgi:mannose-1-phosphate guanylyltransferase/mannose-6-phosphate isomerase
MSNIVPVILSGGSGTRLWPASRSMYPKQLMPLVGKNTMLQDTALRLAGMTGTSDECLVICNDTHRFLVAEQMRAIDQGARIILEPEGRNTAPAIALAAFTVAEQDGDALLLIMPADHVITDMSAFQAAVAISGHHWMARARYRLCRLLRSPMPSPHNSTLTAASTSGTAACSCSAQAAIWISCRN